MDLCSLEELVTLQYGSFYALSEWAKQLTWRITMAHVKMSHFHQTAVAKDMAPKQLSAWQEWGCSYWDGSSTIHLLCKRESCNSTCKDAATPTRPQWLRTQPPNNCLCRACWLLLIRKSWNRLRMFNVDGTKWHWASSPTDIKTS